MGNPLDLGDLFDFDFYIWIIENTLRQENIDGVLFLHIYAPGYEGRGSRRLLQSLADLAEKYSKPIALCLYSRQAELAELHQELKYPIFVSPERAVSALDMGIKYHSRKLFLAENNEIIQPDPPPDINSIRNLIDAVVQERRSFFDP